MPWAVPSGAGGGEGGAALGGSSGWSWAVGHQPALGQEAGEPFDPHAAPQLPIWGGAQGTGPSGVVRACRREPHKVDSLDGGDLLGPQEGVYPLRCLGRREGEAVHGRCPVEVSWVLLYLVSFFWMLILIKPNIPNLRQRSIERQSTGTQ